MSTESVLEQRLHDLFAVALPDTLARRVEAAIESTPTGQSNPRLRRGAISLMVAGILIATAAGPAVEWFEGWDRRYDRLWELGTPVGRSVTEDGYRVTIHRAYADRLGVRLATTVEDLEDRWSEIEVDGAEMTDAAGNAYEAWNWSGTRTPFDSTAATWSRFLLPPGVLRQSLDLQVTVTSLAVRTREPLAVGIPPEQIWSSVGGAWMFDVKVPVTAGSAVRPTARTTEAGITITLDELSLTPSGAIARFTVDGLPAMSDGTELGWFPSMTVKRNGKKFSDDAIPPGVVRSGDAILVELIPDEDFTVDDLSGHWTVSIITFTSFDSVTQVARERDGPWVLEFEVPATS